MRGQEHRHFGMDSGGYILCPTWSHSHGGAHGYGTWSQEPCHHSQGRTVIVMLRPRPPQSVTPSCSLGATLLPL